MGIGIFVQLAHYPHNTKKMTKKYFAQKNVTKKYFFNIYFLFGILPPQQKNNVFGFTTAMADRT